jgi:hypothetical protein
MDPIEVEMAPERRARLIAKGHFLYGKYCGLDGRGICAERFALHHIRLGEPIVARDLIGYLEGRIVALRLSDPDNRLAITDALANRIRCHLRGEES